MLNVHETQYRCLFVIEKNNYCLQGVSAQIKSIILFMSYIYLYAVG